MVVVVDEECQNRDIFKGFFLIVDVVLIRERLLRGIQEFVFWLLSFLYCFYSFFVDVFFRFFR